MTITDTRNRQCSSAESVSTPTETHTHTNRHTLGWEWKWEAHLQSPHALSGRLFEVIMETVQIKGFDKSERQPNTRLGNHTRAPPIQDGSGPPSCSANGMWHSWINRLSKNLRAGQQKKKTFNGLYLMNSADSPSQRIDINFGYYSTNWWSGIFS